ncbi:MAG: hypothetical protein ACI4UM_09125 [Succinivibrio sp.]
MSEFKDPKSYLPHREPMILIDRVISITPNGAVAESDISKSGALREMLDDNGDLDSYFAIELIAQTIGLWNGYHQKDGDSQLGMLLGARDLICKTDRFAHDKTVTIEVNKVMFDGTLANFEGKIIIDDTVAARGNINVISLTDEMKDRLFGR